MKQKYILTLNVVIIAHGWRKYIRIIVRGFSPECNKDLYIVASAARCTVCLTSSWKLKLINKLKALPNLYLGIHF